MKTKIDLKPSKLISEREKLVNEISYLWKIIATENVLHKGVTRNYDIKEVLNRIKELYEDMVLLKIKIQCTNMGIKLKDLPADANIINIYKLSVYNEYIVKVNEIKNKHTLNPRTIKYKRKKFTEELSFAMLKQEKDKYTLKANEIRKKIEDFNNSEIEEDNSTPLYLAA